MHARGERNGPRSILTPRVSGSDWNAGHHRLPIDEDCGLIVGIACERVGSRALMLIIPE